MEQILAILLQNFRVAAQLSFAAPCRGACALGTDFFPTGEELRRIRSQRGGQGVDFPDLFFFFFGNHVFFRLLGFWLNVS